MKYLLTKKIKIMQKKNLLSLFLVYLCIPLVTIAQLSGTYTIGGTSPDYTTFSDAVAGLSSGGISGNVIFNVRDGEYEEQFKIPLIDGVSETDTIIFQSESADSSAVTIHFNATDEDNYIVNFDDAEYITIKDLTLKASGDSLYGHIILMTNTTANINVVNCHLYGKTGSTNYFRDKVIVLSEDGGTDSSIVFFNNILEHNQGSNIMYESCYDCDFIGNHFDADLYLKNFEISLIENNFHGGQLELRGGMGITKNIIRNNVLNTDMFIVDCPNESDGNETHIYNNMIYDDRVVLRSCYDVCFYHNTVINNSDYAFRSYTYSESGNSGNLQVYNNIFITDDANDPAVSFESIDYFSVLDNNVVYGTNILYQQDSDDVEVNYAALAEWQAASGLSANSVKEYVNFVSSDDLHVCINQPTITGSSMAGITTDIDGDARNTDNPVVGADEYTYVEFVAEISEDTICEGVTVDLSSTNMPVGDISWQDTLGNELGTGILFTYEPPDTMKIIGIWTYNDCSESDTLSVIVEVCTDLEQISDINAVNIFPNPAHNNVVVEVNNSDNYTVTIYDIMGKILINRNNCYTQTIFDISELPDGLYIIEAVSEEYTFVRKFLKE